VKILIVDDEPVARRGLRRQLSELDGIAIVGECDGRDQAVIAIVDRHPDVVLLDIQLGRRTAFEIIEEIGVDAMPLVIFVTAYDKHALKAFEAHALDYVLKPVDPARLRDALERAASLLALKRGATLADRLEGFLADRAAAPLEPTAVRGSTTRFVVRDNERLRLLDVGQIERFESMGNYVRVHAGGQAYVMRATMDTVSQRLAANADFIRVRRSAIVNLRAIAALERYAKSTYLIRLKAGSTIVSSRYYLPAIRALLRGSG
jgi:two-component system, LytTR family, response regulator